MNDQQLDKYIAESYQGSTEGYDHEALWAAIEPELDNRRRPIVLWMVVGAGLLLCVLASMYIGDKPLGDSVSLSDTSILLSQQPTENSEERESSLSDSATAIPSSSEEYTAGATVIDTESSDVTNIRTADDQAPATPLPANDAVSVESNDRDIVIQQARATSSPMRPSTMQVIASSDNAAIAENRPFLASPMIDRRLSMVTTSRALALDLPALALPAKTTRKTGVRQGLEVHVGYEKLIDRLNLIAATRSEDYQQRSDQELALDRFTAGLQYIKPLYDRWEIILGGQFSQNTTVREAMDVSDNTVTRQVLVERIHSEQGVEEIYADVEVTQTITSASQTYLRDQELGLLVGARYHAWANERCSVFGEAYVSPLLTVGRSGSITYDGDLYDTKVDTDMIYSTGMAVDGQLGLGLAYHLHDRLDVVGRLVATRRLTETYTETYGIQLQRSTIGLRLGVVRRF